MSSYRVDGSILIVTLVGASTRKDLRSLFDAVRADPTVPDRAPLLLDSRRAEAKYGEAELRDRVKLLADSLGPKLGPACAVVVSENIELVAHSFQKITGEHNLRTGLFRDLESALRWLRVYATAYGPDTDMRERPVTLTEKHEKSR